MSEDQLTLEDITPIVEDGSGTIVPDEDLPEVEAVSIDHDEEEKVDVLHVLEPLDEPVDVVLSLNGQSQTYTQKPLSFFSKMEFMRLVGTTLDEAMKGEDGLKVNSLFGEEMDVGGLTSGDFADLDSFLGLVSKIAKYAPEFLKECYLVWLDVPKKERAWAREALDNLSDEIGFEVIERFIDQNWEALESFFVVQIGRLLRRVADRRKKD